MNIDDHKRIASMAEAYADRMCDGDENRKFSRGGVASAYICGGVATLHRVCDVIRVSEAVAGGLSAEQTRKLLGLIKQIEMTPQTAQTAHDTA